jgi:hypothetical protein
MMGSVSLSEVQDDKENDEYPPIPSRLLHFLWLFFVVPQD